MICSAAKGGWKGKGEERDGTDERGACRVRTSDRSDSGSVTACQRKAKGGGCKMNIPPIGTIGHPKVPNRNFFIHLYPGPEIGDLPGRRHDWGVDKFVRKQRSADTTQSVVVIFLPPGAKQGEPGARGIGLALDARITSLTRETGFWRAQLLLRSYSSNTSEYAAPLFFLRQ